MRRNKHGLFDSVVWGKSAQLVSPWTNEQQLYHFRGSNLEWAHLGDAALGIACEKERNCSHACGTLRQRKPTGTDTPTAL